MAVLYLFQTIHRSKYSSYDRTYALDQPVIMRMKWLW